MKLIFRSALVVLFAVVLDQAWLSAQETQSGDMRLYLLQLLNGNRGRRLCPLEQRWPRSKATQRKKVRS
jgi:hypothetical protein